MPSRIESETVITYNLEDKIAHISTNIQKDKNRMEKLEVIPVNVEDDVEFYEIPMSWIKINPPRKLREERRKALQKRGNELVHENKVRNLKKNCQIYKSDPIELGGVSEIRK